MKATKLHDWVWFIGVTAFVLSVASLFVEPALGKFCTYIAETCAMVIAIGYGMDKKTPFLPWEKQK